MGPAVRNSARCGDAGGSIDVANEADAIPIPILSGTGCDAIRRSGSPECLGGECEQQPHRPESKQAVAAEEA